jgi:hypothetical protein
MVNTLTQAEWIARCAGQLLRIDPKLSSDEATGLAHEFFAFQRTAAMTPEAAADFVAAELAQAQPRFERRTAPRA